MEVPDVVLLSLARPRDRLLEVVAEGVPAVVADDRTAERDDPLSLLLRLAVVAAEGTIPETEGAADLSVSLLLLLAIAMGVVVASPETPDDDPVARIPGRLHLLLLLPSEGSSAAVRTPDDLV